MKLEEKYLNEQIFNMIAIVGNKKVTKPVVAKNIEDAKKQFSDFIKSQIKFGHLENGKIKVLN